MKENTAEDDIRQWLETTEGQRALKQASKRVHRSMSAAGIPLTDLGVSATSSPRDAEDEIRSNLCLVILENQREIAKKLRPPEADPVRILAREMLRRLMDRARWSPRNDPFRYLYKIAADAIRQDGGIHLKAKGTTGSLYSLEEKSFNIGPLCEEDCAAVPFPHHLVGSSQLADVSTRKALLTLANRFWHGISRQFQDRPVWIELRDLIQWIRIFVPMETAKPVPQDEAGEVIGHDDAPAAFDPVVVRAWADDFSRLLNDKEAQAFHFYYGREMSLAEVARRMGFKGASGPTFHLGRVKEKLHEFAAERRWLSADGAAPPHRLAQRLFKEMLAEVLKNRVGTP